MRTPDTRLAQHTRAYRPVRQSAQYLTLQGRRRRVLLTAIELRDQALAAAALAVSPTPPSPESRPGAFGAALEERAHSFCQWGKSGSAENPWKSGFRRAKSLIPQANPSTSRCRFSTGCRAFSTGRVLAVRPAPLSFSLSKSLKEKEKGQGKRQAEHAQGHPRVEGVFPRLPRPAYFHPRIPRVGNGQPVETRGTKILFDQRVMRVGACIHGSTGCAACARPVSRCR